MLCFLSYLGKSIKNIYSKNKDKELKSISLSYNVFIYVAHNC